MSMLNYAEIVENAALCSALLSKVSSLLSLILQFTGGILKFSHGVLSGLMYRSIIRFIYKNVERNI